MAIADGKVSLKHLVTMETLTNEEVLGLIRRGGDFKNGRADFQLDRQYFAACLQYGIHCCLIGIQDSLYKFFTTDSGNVHLSEILQAGL